MDVQTENMDPPPNESQPTGKIRKGFKLFGKRKPGNIFSIRKKGDGNNKSSVSRSKTSEGLSETSTQDSEQEQDKENGKEVKQEDGEQPEDEALGEDDALATAPARTSISSASSAKSLSFLSLLRGGRRAVGDRRAQTVTQPPARQRRGLKGLFSNVKLRSRDKEDKEEAPPSPLLQSSRTNSVEIIKDDMTLTPKCQPRTLDSSETESTEPVQSSTTQESSAMTASKTPAPQVKSAETVSPTKEHVSPLLTPEPPLVPGDNSLSSLLADISSLLTFDSISGGGDIMADVEAEWGKVSSALNANVPVSSTSPFSKPTLSSSTTTSSTVSSTATVKPSSVAVSSSSFTLTSHPVKLSSDSIPATMQGKQTPAPSLTKPSTAPSSSATSSISKTIQSTPSSTTTTPPANASATVEKVSSFSPTLTSTANYMATEIAPNKAPASPDSPDGAGEQVIQGLPSKTKEQLPPKEKKTSQSKATGLSKIPVVGGGRVSRQPVREAHHYEPSKDPTSPVVEEKHGFNSHSAAGREKMVSPEANAPASKHHPVEHQQPQQSKVVTSSARDSKIPLKHDTQFHAASQVSQTKEPPRTKIPVSKVPVRRAANKPATTGSSMQIRK
ncbi:APC membrane recruitment protein 2 isoform X2 [Cyprinodon tularosa]|uniref:APC membrane recruitment protein 2 isoform X2 n=1 Tax=Cyprinodon tularosa TaxID=77115 RepID=UPI0018E25E00|nr:APC membrane recruitment protein 2 isoform X2 [Cyprinodon tularosa]